MKSTLYPTTPATTAQAAPKPLEVVEVSGVTHVRSTNGALISIE